MTIYTGQILTPLRNGFVDSALSVVGSITWNANLTTADTLVLPTPFGRDIKALVERFVVIGTVPDTNATPTFAFKVGTALDDDGFLVNTVAQQKTQLNLEGFGALVRTRLAANQDIIAAITANPTTAVSAGTWYYRVFYRQVLD